MKRILLSGILATSLLLGSVNPTNAALRINDLADCAGNMCYANNGTILVRVAPLNREDTIFAGKVTTVNSRKGIYQVTSGARSIRVKIKAVQ